ncbi:helix-turn-helix transcriptional regulator [Enterobacter cloacae]
MSRMEINEIRRRNLRALLDTHLASGKKKKDFAETIGIEAPQLTHVTATPPTRNIGDTIARRIESNLGLQRGWLDVAQDLSKLTSENGFSLGQVFEQPNTGQNHSNSFTLIKLSDHDFIGDAKLESYSTVITELSIDEEYARTMFGGRASSDLRIYTAHGDSMLGTINPGEVVVLDISVSNIPTDGIYLFDFKDEIHLKRLQRVKSDLLVISDNSTYDKWVVNDDERSDLKIIGLLVGKWDMTYTRLG